MTMNLRGKCSWFGGPQDTGVSPSEGLAFIYKVEDAPQLFLPTQPSGTTGLARRLDPEVFYIACRWDYNQYPKPSLLQHMALVRAPKTGRKFLVYPADWGPHSDTDRVADISPGLMAALGIQTDDEVEVTYPYADQPEEIHMPYDRVVISSGHGKIVRGASGSPVPPLLDEVNEARRVVDFVAELLITRGCDAIVFHDNTSTSQSQNLNTIVAAHNKETRQLDISVHFNAFDGNAQGTEVLYVSQQDLAADMSLAISKAGGFTNRGAKKRTDLAFLNNTHEPAILLEVCFCDNRGDSDKYNSKFEAICGAIADVIGGKAETGTTPPPVTPVEPADIPRVDIQVTGEVLIYVNGTQVGTKG
jgi:N-acetylmuramoyl-L-alanine amidase